MTGERTLVPFPRENPRFNMEALHANKYPGRGIVMGIDETGEQAVQIYWVMGRSKNSRNRILVAEDDVVKTVAFDESIVEDPSLIIYNAMRGIDGINIVSNGDQTDTIVSALKRRGSVSEAVFEAIFDRTYEPDAPNYTPRISGVIFPGNETGNILFSKISRESEESDRPSFDFYASSSSALQGKGRCIHTYDGDGDPLPAFSGRPYDVLLEGLIDDMASTYWELLNEQNRVALAAKTINLATGETDLRIINKLKK